MTKYRTFKMLARNALIITSLCATVPLISEDWNVDGNGIWNLAGNWNPANIPTGGIIPVFVDTAFTSPTISVDM